MKYTVDKLNIRSTKTYMCIPIRTKKRFCTLYCEYQELDIESE